MFSLGMSSPWCLRSGALPPYLALSDMNAEPHMNVAKHGQLRWARGMATCAAASRGMKLLVASMAYAFAMSMIDAMLGCWLLPTYFGPSLVFGEQEGLFEHTPSSS